MKKEQKYKQNRNTRKDRKIRKEKTDKYYIEMLESHLKINTSYIYCI